METLDLINSRENSDYIMYIWYFLFFSSLSIKFEFRSEVCKRPTDGRDEIRRNVIFQQIRER